MQQGNVKVMIFVFVAILIQREAFDYILRNLKPVTDNYK